MGSGGESGPRPERAPVYCHRMVPSYRLPSLKTGHSQKTALFALCTCHSGVIRPLPGRVCSRPPDMGPEDRTNISLLILIFFESFILFLGKIRREQSFLGVTVTSERKGRLNYSYEAVSPFTRHKVRARPFRPGEPCGWGRRPRPLLTRVLCVWARDERAHVPVHTCDNVCDCVHACVLVWECAHA